MTKLTELLTKRFVIRKSLIGKNVKVKCTFSDGKKVEYMHDEAYKIMKSKLDTMPCFKKYKSYTSTTNIPVVLRNKKLI